MTGRPYEEYLGIPFARPPVGELRWQKPQPPEQWQAVLAADTYSDHCIQWPTRLYPLLGLGGTDSEDCLYLNVYVPRGVSSVRWGPTATILTPHGPRSICVWLTHTVQ